MILREHGAAYYAASLPQVYGLSSYPNLRPVAIDAVNSDAIIYAGIHQSVLGQIGFRADTRVSGIKVETVNNLTNWYGTAHGADSFTGKGDLTTTAAEVGGNWQALSGSWQRSERGLTTHLTTQDNHNLAILDLNAPSGLIHLAIAIEQIPADVGIIWRFQDRNNYWCCRLHDLGFRIELVKAGQITSREGTRARGQRARGLNLLAGQR